MSDPLLTQTGRFATENASRYLQQLCKHFAHKVTVDYDESQGTAALPPGPARLIASDVELQAEISAADEAGLEKARFIIEDHLQRFAFREGFERMEWR